MAAPVTMTVDARGTIPRSIIRAAEAMPDVSDGGPYEGMELELAQGQYPPPENRCTCCPYGYHIDLDFLRYCESLNNGSYLRNLKKIKKNKRKLRKSMEVFLNSQGQPALAAPPPDVVHSTETFMNYMEHEDVSSRPLLDEIDSSVDNFDLIQHPRRRVYKGSGDYDEPDSYYDDYDSGSPSPGYGRQPPYHVGHPRDPSKYRSETEMVLHQAPKSESISSLLSSESDPPSSSGDYRTTITETEKHYRTQTHTYITAAQLEGQFAQLTQDVPALEGVPETQPSITPEALKAIREQMATSLQRLRELEEQVKIIPVLQVRLSVLKEEKRLQDLHTRARNNKPNLRTIGVGDCRIDDFDKPDGRSGSSSPSTRMFEMTEFQSINRKNLRRPHMRSVGTGDGNVFAQEMQLQVTQQQRYGQQDNRVHERELHTEESSHITEKEKEVHTLVIGNEQNRLATIKRGEMRIPTRSIGVGSGNVFDTSSNVHVHEKEMRTVIIGGPEQAKKQHRNVGVSCRAAMRDVGVMYYYEDVKPTTRNVAVGVGEGMMVGIYDENGGGGESSTSVHQTLTSLQQMNMAAFHTRNINIKSEHLRIILDQMLKKTVHSVGTMCKMSTEDKGTSHIGYDLVSVGCGTDSTEVEIRPKVTTRSIGVENKPATMSRSMITESKRTSDTGVNTQRSQVVHRASNTEGVTTFPAMTNTETPRMFSVPTETDPKMFQALNQIRNTGTNTNKVITMNSETNTEYVGRNLKTYSVNTDIRFVDKGINTTNVKNTTNRMVNTDEVRTRTTGVGDFSINQHVDCDICLVKPTTQKTVSTTEREVVQQVQERDQRPQIEVTRHVQQQPTAPSGYSREMTVQSRMRGGSPGSTMTREITETTVRGGRRTSPIGMTQEQIMQHHLSGGTQGFEQMTEELLQSQMRGEDSSTAEQIVERTIGTGGQSGGVTREVTIESRSGRSRPVVETHTTTVVGGGGSGGRTTREVTEERIERTLRSTPQVTKEIVIEGRTGRGGLGGSGGSLREVVEVQTSGTRGIGGGGGRSSTTTTTETTEETRSVRSTPQYGQHVTKEVVIEGRSGRNLMGGSMIGGGGSSSTTTTEETRTVQGSPRYGQHVTKEVVIEGRSGRNLMGGSTIRDGGSSSTTTTEETRTVRSTPQYGQHVTKEVVIEGRSGRNLMGGSMIGGGGSSTTTTEEVVERSVRSSPQVQSGGTLITREITIGGRVGGGSHLIGGGTQHTPRTGTVTETSTRTIVEKDAPTSKTIIEKETPGGVKIERKPSREERMRQYTVGSTKVVEVGSSSQEKIIEPRLRASEGTSLSSSTSSISSSSSATSGTSASTVRSASGGGGGGGAEVQFIPDGKGGTQMKVVRTTETAFVGNQPVHSHSDVVVAGVEDADAEQQQSGFSTSVSSRVAGIEDAHAGQQKSGFSSSMSSSSSSSSSRVAGGGSVSGGGVSRVTGGGGVVSGGGGGAGSSTTVKSASYSTSSSSKMGGAGAVGMAGALGGGAGAMGMMGSMGGSGAMGGTGSGFSSSVQSSSSSSSSSGGTQRGGGGRTVTTVTETKVERRGAPVSMEDDGSGSLRSIMKKPGSSPVPAKKGIKFAEEVSGGYVSSSSSSSTSDSDEPEAEAQNSDTDSHSSDSVSFDEGSYDGRHGQIVYQCKDDEAILAQGSSAGAAAAAASTGAIYDQSIRETFELAPEMKEACGTYATWLEDSSRVNTQQLNQSVNHIQQEWFKVSSQKLSNPAQVEDFLSSFKEMSPNLLSQIVNMADANGNSALHYAVSHCNTEVIDLLLDSGAADIDKQNKAGYTAVMLASLATVTDDNQRHAVGRLFKSGDVNARASQAGQTALMLAVSHGRMDMVRLLLEADAEVNVQDDDGSTALMCACEHGHTDIVKMLLAHQDCDPTVADNDGSTALSIAMEAGHRDVGVLLYAHVNFKQGSPVDTEMRTAAPTKNQLPPHMTQPDEGRHHDDDDDDRWRHLWFYHPQM